jgi:DTW domain-containing protein YfiP
MEGAIAPPGGMTYAGPMPGPMTSSAPAPDARCPACGKAAPLCLCAEIAPLDNRIEVLILQHPQEQDVGLGTARLTVAHLRKAALRVGLSWPSLAKALGRPADPKRWGVLYLGSADAARLAPGREVVALTRKGTAAPDQDARLRAIEGIVLLDGSWSQAKALWWRNPWLLKAQRLILAPSRASRYGRLRREARPDAVSTLEAAALLLGHLEGRSDIPDALHRSFETLLERAAATRS